MTSGNLAIFGYAKPSTSRLIESYTSNYHVPYISLSHPSLPAPGKLSKNYDLHMHPDMVPLLISLLKYYRWSFIYYVYNNDEGKIFCLSYKIRSD